MTLPPNGSAGQLGGHDGANVSGTRAPAWKTAAKAALIMACSTLFGFVILYAPFPDARGLCIGADDPRALPTTVVSVEMLQSCRCRGPAEYAHLDWAMPPTAVDTILDLTKFADSRTIETPAEEPGVNPIKKHEQRSAGQGSSILPASCPGSPACFALQHGPENNGLGVSDICLPKDESARGHRHKHTTNKDAK